MKPTPSFDLKPADPRDRALVVAAARAHKAQLPAWVDGQRNGSTSVYQALLSEPDWIARRNAIVARDGRCLDCGRVELLNVHHRYYYAGRKPWEYPNEAFATLCDGCHKDRHGLIDAIKRMLGELSACSLEQLFNATKQLVRADGDARDEQERIALETESPVPVQIQYDANLLVEIMNEIRTTTNHSKR